MKTSDLSAQSMAVGLFSQMHNWKRFGMPGLGNYDRIKNCE